MDPTREDLLNAVDTNNIEEVKRLITLGVDPSIALVPAAEFNHHEILSYLISSYEFDEKDLSLALIAATSNGSEEAANILYGLPVIPDYVRERASTLARIMRRRKALTSGSLGK